MNLDCVNNGGLKTIISVSDILEYETAVELPLGSSAAVASWQVRQGDIMTVIDRQGDNWRVRLDACRDGTWSVVPFEKLRRPVESVIETTVYQALPDKERFELIMQKLTELGACRIVPMTTRYSSTREKRDAVQRKSHRWPDVLRRAAKQCRRAMIPELTEVSTYAAALEDASRHELSVILYEGDAPWSLDELLYKVRPRRVALMVGPEGGFDPEEIGQAQELGVLPASLGPRILRTETAAIAALTAVQYAVGDLTARQG